MSRPPKQKFGHNISGSGRTVISCSETIFVFVSNSVGIMGWPYLVQEVLTIMIFMFDVSNFPFLFSTLFVVLVFRTRIRLGLYSFGFCEGSGSKREMTIDLAGEYLVTVPLLLVN